MRLETIFVDVITNYIWLPFYPLISSKNISNENIMVSYTPHYSLQYG